MKYFIQTTRFYPNSYKDLGFIKTENNLYLYSEDNSIWAERDLYDLGYGREIGYYRLPALSFNQLVSLIFVDLDEEINDKKYNYWGALSVALDDYCEELIQYIKTNIPKKVLFEKYNHIYTYINAELNIPDNLVRKLSEKKLIKCCCLWKEFILD